MSNDEKYPTIERLADLTNTTVGYQKPDLEREAVLCWRELVTLRERLAEAETPSTLRDAIAAGDGTMHGAIDYWQTRAQQAEQRAERAEKDAERMEAIEKHGLKIVTDFVIDSLVAERTFGSVRELFDAAIASRSAT